MNRYTKEDLALLNDMVSVSWGNFLQNIQEQTFSYHMVSSYSDKVSYTKFRLFNPTEVLSGLHPAETVINKVIDFWCDMSAVGGILKGKSTKSGAKMLRDLILENPLREMPHYLNNTDGTGIIAKWRLQIGK